MRRSMHWGKGILSLSLDEYLKLLDWTGRKVIAGKRGSIPADAAPILDRLQINESGWLAAVVWTAVTRHRFLSSGDSSSAIASTTNHPLRNADSSCTR